MKLLPSLSFCLVLVVVRKLEAGVRVTPRIAESGSFDLRLF